jgi:hypothetical protein
MLRWRILNSAGSHLCSFDGLNRLLDRGTTVPQTEQQPFSLNTAEYKSNFSTLDCQFLKLKKN